MTISNDCSLRHKQMHAQYDEDEKIGDMYSVHRICQAYQLSKFINLVAENSAHSRTGSDLILLAGDLNTSPGELPFKLLLSMTGLVDCCMHRYSHDVKRSLLHGTQDIQVDEDLITCGHHMNTYSVTTSSQTTTTNHASRELTSKPSGKRIDFILFKLAQKCVCKGDHDCQCNIKHSCFGSRIECHGKDPVTGLSFSDHQPVSLNLVVKRTKSRDLNLASNKLSSFFSHVNGGKKRQASSSDAGDTFESDAKVPSEGCLSMKEKALRVITSQINFKNGSIFPSNDAFEADTSSSSDSGAEASASHLNDSDSSTKKLLEDQPSSKQPQAVSSLLVTSKGEASKVMTVLDSAGQTGCNLRSSASLRHGRHDHHRNKPRSFSVGHSHTTSSKDGTTTTTTTTTHKHNDHLDFESEESKSVLQKSIKTRGRDNDFDDGDDCFEQNKTTSSLGRNVIANALTQPSNVLLEMFPKRSNSVLEAASTTTTIVSSAKVHFSPETTISHLSEPSLKHLEATCLLLVHYLDDRHVCKKRFYVCLLGFMMTLMAVTIFASFQSCLDLSPAISFHIIFLLVCFTVVIILLTEFTNRFERTAIKGILEEVMVLLSFAPKNHAASILH